MQITIDPSAFKQLEQVQRTLREMGPQIEKRVMGNALLGFAREVSKDAKRLAPKRTGQLRKAIRAARYKNRTGFPPAAYVTTRNKRYREVNYGFIVEHGVAGRFRPRKFLEKAYRRAEGQGLRAFVNAYNKAFRQYAQREIRKSYAQGFGRD